MNCKIRLREWRRKITMNSWSLKISNCKDRTLKDTQIRPVRFTNFWILDLFGFSEQKLRFDSSRFFSTIKNHTTRFESILYSDQKSQFNSGFIRYQVGWDPTQLQFTTAKVQLNSWFIGQNQANSTLDSFGTKSTESQLNSDSLLHSFNSTLHCTYGSH